MSRAPPNSPTECPPEPTTTQIADAKKRILKAINEKKIEEAFKELMTHPSGRQMDYEESRMMYG